MVDMIYIARDYSDVVVVQWRGVGAKCDRPIDEGGAGR